MLTRETLDQRENLGGNTSIFCQICDYVTKKISHVTKIFSHMTKTVQISLFLFNLQA